jgi:ADP-ribose pyrophosphatase YjhB (NUDIX family)
MQAWGAKRRESYRGPLAATDIIIAYDHPERGEGIILIGRGFQPYGLALPGGFAEPGISLEENALKEAREETGLEVILHHPEHPLCVRSSPTRDPREHIMSIVYVGRGTGTIRAGDDAKSARHYTIEEAAAVPMADYAFPDHHTSVHEFLSRYLKPEG